MAAYGPDPGPGASSSSARRAIAARMISDLVCRRLRASRVIRRSLCGSSRTLMAMYFNPCNTLPLEVGQDVADKSMARVL